MHGSNWPSTFIEGGWRHHGELWFEYPSHGYRPDPTVFTNSTHTMILGSIKPILSGRRRVTR